MSSSREIRTRNDIRRIQNDVLAEVVKVLGRELRRVLDVCGTLLEFGPVAVEV